MNSKTYLALLEAVDNLYENLLVTTTDERQLTQQVFNLYQFINKYAPKP